MPKIPTRRLVQIALIVVVLLGIAALTQRLLKKTGAAQATLRMAPVKRSDLVATISATGTVEPVEVVDVGAQVAGQINSFGKDQAGKPIDYGSSVEAGTILAQIDDSLYAADVEAAKAQLQQGHANQLSAEANLLQTQARLVQAQQDWDRAQKLGPSEALAPAAYDQYRANYEVAKANLAVGKAAVEQAKAAVAQAQASLARAERNLGYCTIKSPVKGVIIDRRVNIGQTVVASLNAPSLFLIAKDLTRIQVWISVNEADIGHIRPGQAVTFTVDAFPGETFLGEVGKVRLNATMTQNVVTYTVEVNTDNSDGKLLPYLTANAQFVTGTCHQVLVVPNAALRWQPQPAQIAPEFRKPGETVSRVARASVGSSGTPENSAAMRGTIWVKAGEYVRPISVKAGLTDGTSTEVEGPELAEGMQVVLGEAVSAAPAASGPSASPFTPQIRRSRGGMDTNEPTGFGRPPGSGR